MKNLEVMLNVVRFFLDLYKLHLGAKEDDAAIFVRARSEAEGKNFSYELRIKHEGKWCVRRVTVGPIGEDSGAKSMCFKVTYGDTIVVKIPPENFASFDDYLAEINTSSLIAEQLEPEVKCIAPEVSVLLKHIPSFLNRAGNLSKDDPYLEKKLKKRLPTFSKFHNYYKINGKYTFFMNLSQYAFLGDVINGMHKIDKPQIIAEINQAQNCLWEQMDFIRAYGQDNLSIWQNLHQSFMEYEKEVALLTKKHGLTEGAPTYKLKEFFVTHLSEKEVKPENWDAPPPYIDDLNIILEKKTWDYRKDIKTYHRLLKSHLKNQFFYANRSKMGGIITNSMVLLARLKQKGVAIRDIKPDNLFVVGDSSRLSLFLASPEEYDIGVIDFETAAPFKKKQKGKIPQPLLGGTPTYATLSNFMINDLLDHVFPNLARILYLQDWYATVGMVYHIVTGDTLFEKTRKLLPEILTMMQQSPRDAKQMVEFFKTSSAMFWSGAAREIESKLRKAQDKLSAVEANLPEEVIRMLREEILIEHKRLNNKIRKLVVSQPFFKTKQTHQSILEASSQKIRLHIKKWQNPANFRQVETHVKTSIIRFFQNLERFKIRSEKQIRLAKLLASKSGPSKALKMTVHDLMEILFHIVHQAMCDQEWEIAAMDEEFTPPETADSDETYEATVTL
jgi:serine/threonine protein kinase